MCMSDEWLISSSCFACRSMTRCVCIIWSLRRWSDWKKDGNLAVRRHDKPREIIRVWRAWTPWQAEQQGAGSAFYLLRLARTTAPAVSLAIAMEMAPLYIHERADWFSISYPRFLEWKCSFAPRGNCVWVNQTTCPPRLSKPLGKL